MPAVYYLLMGRYLLQKTLCLGDFMINSKISVRPHTKKAEGFARLFFVSAEKINLRSCVVELGIPVQCGS